ncbi:hypothetical protein ACFQ3N_00535 [Virgibacillus byunsanensis]|uniref:Uncharacterized protein n=1 Tax=Virgibacillus byunsanensis TaxID=570945 RepID=A0ABW3LEV7_9BACI
MDKCGLIRGAVLENLAYRQALMAEALVALMQMRKFYTLLSA